jgi:hypothetical protein
VQLSPADIARPERGSNLNTVAGQAPTPNKVDTKSSATAQWRSTTTMGRSTTYTAVVEPSGSLARSVGAISASGPTTGSDRVKFQTDITECIYSATPGTAGDGSVLDRITHRCNRRALAN